uniref:ORF59a n=1 Tax=Pinus thunbergii TaxID=3350 RepID=Q32930_PINTH|nr:ORF59a [Pinus thunbergii]BAA04318.1 ORF59a [Pinus thunbergii]
MSFGSFMGDRERYEGRSGVFISNLFERNFQFLSFSSFFFLKKNLIIVPMASTSVYSLFF